MKLTPDANAPESDGPGVVLMAGQPVGGGRYTLKKLLGQGGMGVVWLAGDERLRQNVALKFLPAHIRSDPVALDDMRRETARSIRLSHPNIVRIHDLHEIEGQEAFISMEYVEGLTLHALRVEQPDRVFSWTFLSPLVKQLCAAMDYAHGERVIHRDLKPANMMLDARGRLKLADFGIAAVVSDSLSRISLKRPTSGTPTHMSPQQMNGQAPRVTDDIYSLGASLYELLTSRPPFYTGDIAHQVLDVPATPMADRLADLELTNEIPPDVAALVMACLAKDPAQRPQSARAVADWIGLNISTESSPASTPSDRKARTAEGRATNEFRKLLLLAGAVAGLLAMGLAGGYVVTHMARKPGQAEPRPQVQTQTPPGASPSEWEGLVVLDEEFEDLDAEGKPKSWHWDHAVTPGFSFNIKEAKGNHFLQFTSTKNDQGINIWRDLKLDPQWKALKVTFRVKLQNLKINPNEKYCGAFVNLLWKDARGTQIKWDGTPQVERDTDWISSGSIGAFIPPQQAELVDIIVQFLHASGTMSFDDLKVAVVEPGPKDSPSSAAASEEGFVSLFNGHDLSGWEEFRDWNEGWEKWVVKEGAMTTVAKRSKAPAMIVWRGGLVDDFELRFSYRLGHVISDKHGGCAVIYRETRNNPVLAKDPKNAYNIYLGGPMVRGQGGNLAEIGQNVIATEQNGQDRLAVVGLLGNPAELAAAVKDADWNDCAIIVQGHHHIYKVNGRTMIEFRDENVAQRTSRGELHLFLWNGEGFPPLPVQFKNIRLKRLDRGAVVTGSENK